MRTKRRAGERLNTPLTAPFTHFQAMTLFALIISLAFGTLGRRRPKERLRYAAWSFALFLLIGIAIGWVMYPFSR